MGTPSIASLTPTVCGLFGIAPPESCDSSPLAEVIDVARAALDGRAVTRCLVHAVDAVGHQLSSVHPDLLAPVAATAPLRVELRSVTPSMTPVCYASMFTGAPPARHGINRYEKPVLSCDTLFDALVRSGRRVAIVAVADSSIDRIFRGRDIEYYSEKYDPWVTERVIRLLAEDRHHLIVAYHQEYDDVMHGTEPLHPRALRGAENSVFAFSELSRELDAALKVHDLALVFAPDHGAHRDPVTGKGTHGTDCRDDMELSHYWSIRAAGA